MVLAHVLASGFTGIDWLVVVGYLVLTTVLGARLAGRQATIRDFFLGGRKLPWWAICGSIVATEISAATIIGVPTISFRPGGNLTYLQLAIGSILARIVVARYFVAKYYEHEVYSPYDWVGGILGQRVKHATTILFFIGAVLGHGARLFITASVLGVVADIQLVPAIWLMGAFGVGWTLLGGMVTVIWTDVIQFAVIVLGALFALAASVAAVPGGVGEVVRLAHDTGRFTLFDFSTDLSRSYTLWCGLLALPFLNLAAFGTDQVMAQRMFCCRTQADARRAILWSNVSLFIPVLMLGVGIALHAYFTNNPMSTDEAVRYASDQDSVFPMFVVRALPVGVRGIVVAAVFAAAISTFEGALAALSQATMSFFLKPADLEADAAAPTGRTARAVVWSKALVVAWGLLLCVMGMECIELSKHYGDVIQLALSLVRYTYGPLLGIFLLAFLPKRRDDNGVMWAVAIALLTVFGMSDHAAYGDWIVWIGAGVLAVLGWLSMPREASRAGAITVAAAVAVALHHVRLGVDEAGHSIYASTFWHYPIATLMTLGIGYFVGRKKKTAQ